jgi:hypothetical protein
MIRIESRLLAVMRFCALMEAERGILRTCDGEIESYDEP